MLAEKTIRIYPPSLKARVVASRRGQASPPRCRVPRRDVRQRGRCRWELEPPEVRTEVVARDEAVIDRMERGNREIDRIEALGPHPPEGIAKRNARPGGLPQLVNALKQDPATPPGGNVLDSPKQGRPLKPRCRPLGKPLDRYRWATRHR